MATECKGPVLVMDPFSRQVEITSKQGELRDDTESSWGRASVRGIF